MPKFLAEPYETTLFKVVSHIQKGRSAPEGYYSSGLGTYRQFCVTYKPGEKVYLPEPRCPLFAYRTHAEALQGAEEPNSEVWLCKALVVTEPFTFFHGVSDLRIPLFWQNDPATLAMLESVLYHNNQLALGCAWIELVEMVKDV
jgi:hypothetical protein